MDPARESAVLALAGWDPATTFARDVLAPHRDRLADPRDRALATEIVLGVARRRATLDHLLAAFSRTALPRLDPLVRAALRAAAEQVLLLDRVPAHAAVDASVEIVKARTNERLAGYVNAVLRSLVRSIEGPAGGDEDPRRDVPRAGSIALRLRNVAFPDPSPTPDANDAVRYAHPAWLVARWRARHGTGVLHTMLEAGIARGDADDTFDARVDALASADKAARVLLVRAEKSALVGREPDGPAEGVVLPRAAPWPWGDASFDVVRFDAPGSGTGTLARRPEVRDRLRESDLATFARRQSAALARMAPLVRPGGRIVVATRSVEPEDGAGPIAAFVADHAGWRAEPGFLALPEPGHDGGFAAVLVRGEAGVSGPR